MGKADGAAVGTAEGLRDGCGVGARVGVDVGAAEKTSRRLEHCTPCESSDVLSRSLRSPTSAVASACVLVFRYPPAAHPNVGTLNRPSPKGSSKAVKTDRIWLHSVTFDSAITSVDPMIVHDKDSEVPPHRATMLASSVAWREQLSPASTAI